MLLVVVAIVHMERKSRVRRRVKLVQHVFTVCEEAADDILACAEDEEGVFRTADLLAAAPSGDAAKYAPPSLSPKYSPLHALHCTPRRQSRSCLCVSPVWRW